MSSPNTTTTTDRDKLRLSALIKETILLEETVNLDSDEENKDIHNIENSINSNSCSCCPDGTVARTSSLTETMGGGRRVSRASLRWFQEQTQDEHIGLITESGKLSDDYILKRQSVNRPAVLKSIPMLADLTTADTIQSIDGWTLTQLFLSSYAKLAKQVPELNKINVFPIADGDTGTNLKVCLKLPVRNLLLHPSDSILTVASNLAADILLNGQGNSGTILSHFFVSLAESIQQQVANKSKEEEAADDSLTIDEFAACLAETGEKMAHAVPDPVEGTMVSVARDCCSQLSGAGPFYNLHQLLDVWNARAQTELAKTPQQLVVNGTRVLEKAGVVDSGAQGFVYLIEGMFLAAKNELPEASDISLFQQAGTAGNQDDVDTAAHLDVDHTVTDTKYQFCTEAVVVLKEGVNKATVVGSITKLAADEDLGDSIVCVGAPAKQGGTMVKLHIHSNHPERVFSHLQQFNREPILLKEKVEDMHDMRSMAHEHDSEVDGLDLSDAKFTIVMQSTTPLPPRVSMDDLFKLPVFLVPSDTQEPIDIRFTTAGDTLAAQSRQRHEETAVRYTSAAGNPMQIKIELLAALSKGKPVLVFVMSTDKRMSALGRNVLAAIDLLTPEQQAMVKVHVHGWFFSEALYVLEAMQYAQAGKTIDETYEHVKELADRSSMFVSFCSSKSVNKMLAWRPHLFPDGFAVEDGSWTSFGLDPKIREGEPLTDFERLGLLMNVLGTAPTLEQAQDHEIQLIKDSLKPGQKLGSVLVQCIGRPDRGHDFVRKLKAAGIPTDEEPVVYTGSFMSLASNSWGEMGVIYKIIDG